MTARVAGIRLEADVTAAAVSRVFGGDVDDANGFGFARARHDKPLGFSSLLSRRPHWFTSNPALA